MPNYASHQTPPNLELCLSSNKKENKIKDNYRQYQLDPIEKYHHSPSHDLNLDFITSNLLF